MANKHLIFYRDLPESSCMVSGMKRSFNNSRFGIYNFQFYRIPDKEVAVCDGVYDFTVLSIERLHTYAYIGHSNSHIDHEPLEGFSLDSTASDSPNCGK